MEEEWVDEKTRLLFEIATCLHGLDGECSVATHFPLKDGRIVVGRENMNSYQQVVEESHAEVFQDATPLVRHLYKLIVFNTPFSVTFKQGERSRTITWRIIEFS